MVEDAILCHRKRNNFTKGVLIETIEYSSNDLKNQKYFIEQLYYLFDISKFLTGYRPLATR